MADDGVNRRGRISDAGSASSDIWRRR
jgi:hypothetical protein